MQDDQRSENGRSSGGRAPEYDAYSVKDRGEGQKASWNRVGAAWKHRDGKGYDIALDAMPVDGRVTLREKRREEFNEQRRGNPEHQQSQKRER